MCQDVGAAALSKQKFATGWQVNTRAYKQARSQVLCGYVYFVPQGVYYSLFFRYHKVNTASNKLNKVTCEMF